MRNNNLEKRLSNSFIHDYDLENELGIRFENLTIRFSNDLKDINIFGDIYIPNIDEDIVSKYPSIGIYLDMLNANNEIINRNAEYISLDNFLGFTTFNIKIYDWENNSTLFSLEEIDKIKIYPKYSKTHIIHL